MKQLPIYIISLLAIFNAGISVAQDTLQVSESNFAITIYADIGKIGESLFADQTKWEFGLAAIMSRRYAVVAEYGFGSLKPKSVINNGSYTSEGNYFRLGFEYIFTIVPRTYLATGVMYAQANFDDYGHVKIDSELWQSVDETFGRVGLSASWFEWILNTEAPFTKVDRGVWDNFYWGLRYRLRFLISDISQPDFDIFAIPGYGKTYSTVVPAVNLYLKYRIDF